MRNCAVLQLSRRISSIYFTASLHPPTYILPRSSFSTQIDHSQHNQINPRNLSNRLNSELRKMADSQHTEPPTTPANAETTPSQEPTTTTKDDTTTTALPPLSPSEFKTYNRLAEQMEYFHNHFVGMWTTLYTACVNSRRPPNMSLKQFLDEGLRLVHYLEAHHSIEETHLYPLLAKKMPQFKASKANKLLKQHELIHKGMDQFQEYILMCKSREVDLELSVLQEKMDSWGEVLMKHLDDEVKELEAETMRKYWTLEEMRAIPI